MNDTTSQAIVLLIPIYNDWSAASKLLSLLDAAFSDAAHYRYRILLVDDGSTQPPIAPLSPSAASKPLFPALSQVDVLHLRRNLGHQRAIAIGLCYIEAHMPCRAVVVMDGDGEDIPTDIPRLLQRFEEDGRKKAIFAERSRRTERLSFRIFYKLYKAAHLLLTGERVRVGNFSVLPASLLSRLICVSDLWNHYAAAAFKARIPIDTLPLARGYRLDGKSKMNFVSLVTHGLSAMSVYGDRIGVRLLVAATVLFMVLICLLAAMLVVRFSLGIVLPNFVKTAALILLLLIPQMLATALIFVFIVLAGRDSSAFLPIRDYSYFVGDLQTLYRAE